MRAVCVKTVSFNEPQFTGHFPGNPIMPGVLQVEALAQVGGIVMLQQPISDGKGDFFFGGVDKVKWRKPVTPGDVLVMEMVLDTFKRRFGIAKMTGRYVERHLLLVAYARLILTFPCVYIGRMLRAIWFVKASLRWLKWSKNSKNTTILLHFNTAHVFVRNSLR